MSDLENNHIQELDCNEIHNPSGDNFGESACVLKLSDGVSKKCCKEACDTSTESCNRQKSMMVFLW